MFKRHKANSPSYTIGKFPHCDQRILHAPGECKYCDTEPQWQALRLAWDIAFTDYEPEDNELPDPADYARGDKHKLWYGNRAAKNSNFSTTGLDIEDE